MKRGIIFLIFVILAFAIILTGCKEQAGQALRTTSFQKLTPVQNLDSCPDKVYCSDDLTKLMRLDYYSYKGKCMPSYPALPTACKFGCNELKNSCNACADTVTYECRESEDTIMKVTKSPATNCKESTNTYKYCGSVGCTDGSPDCNAPECEESSYTQCENGQRYLYAISPGTDCLPSMAYWYDCPYGCENRTDELGDIYAYCPSEPEPEPEPEPGCAPDVYFNCVGMNSTRTEVLSDCGERRSTEYCTSGCNNSTGLCI